MSKQNYVSDLHRHFMWSQDNLAALIDVTRPKIKKMIEGSASANNIQEALLKEVHDRQMTYKVFAEQAMQSYRLQIIRESES